MDTASSLATPMSSPPRQASSRRREEYNFAYRDDGMGWRCAFASNASAAASAVELARSFSSRQVHHHIHDGKPSSTPRAASSGTLPTSPTHECLQRLTRIPLHKQPHPLAGSPAARRLTRAPSPACTGRACTIFREDANDEGPRRIPIALDCERLGLPRPGQLGGGSNVRQRILSRGF